MNFISLQAIFQKPQYKPMFDKWMAGQGPMHIFVYYQKPYKITAHGEIEELRQGPELIATDGKCAETTVSGCLSFQSAAICPDLIKDLNLAAQLASI